MLELDRIFPLRPESIRPIGDSAGTVRPSRSRVSSVSSDISSAQSSQAIPTFPGIREPAPSDLSPEALRGEVESRLNELLEQVMEDGSIDRSIRVSRDEESGRFVYKSVDTLSGEVIRQFPPEEILRLVRAVREAAGLVFDESA